MKTLLVITPHSILDVITNSSTELFVCDTDKTVEMVKEILAADPNVYGYEEPWVFDLKKYREWKEKDRKRVITLQTVRQYIEEPDDIKYSVINGWFYDIEDPEDLEYLRKHYIEDGDNSGGWWSSSRNPFNDRLRAAEENAANLAKDPNNWRIRSDARTAEVQKIYEETEALEVKPDWWNNPLKYYYHNQPISDLDGKIMIVGESDNSIPYDHFDWIENTFNATRHHLG